jgi:hypothetical protein
VSRRGKNQRRLGWVAGGWWGSGAPKSGAADMWSSVGSGWWESGWRYCARTGRVIERLGGGARHQAAPARGQRARCGGPSMWAVVGSAGMVRGAMVATDRSNTAGLCGQGFAFQPTRDFVRQVGAEGKAKPAVVAGAVGDVVSAGPFAGCGAGSRWPIRIDRRFLKHGGRVAGSWPLRKPFFAATQHF